jgi:hypothetical protein
MQPVDPVDQVPRLQAFRSAHPEISIVPPGRGHPTWTATRDGTLLTSAMFLKRFLDHLEELTGT